MTYETEPIRLDQISDGPKVRTERIDLDHVALLELAESLPPIVVRRIAPDRFQGITGAHRRVVAKRRGETTIDARIIECSDAEALERAISDNLGHGKPVTIGERQSVARRMTTETDWSDRRIAEACGLSNKTVAALRPLRRSTGESPQLNTAGVNRTGVDGKARPATPAVADANREKVREVIAAKPEATVREVASQAGVSVGTVSKIRNAPLTAVPSKAEDAPPTVAEIVMIMPVPGKWAQELDHSNIAREFGRFIDRRMIRLDEDVAVLADGCPADWRDRAATVARSMADEWRLLAEHLTTRAQLKGVR